ncbi:PadR family transcriptional regulator [Brachybacterium squillarum]|uniref:PadR family transcriptional regulator n=1 Tax=Brachybacterium squillarum TaxID=661979 RepID=UPI000262985C|nr:PadR family transcriptional regulator [Brachybacterium squillarum]
MRRHHHHDQFPHLHQGFGPGSRFRRDETDDPFENSGRGPRGGRGSGRGGRGSGRGRESAGPRGREDSREHGPRGPRSWDDGEEPSFRERDGRGPRRGEGRGPRGGFGPGGRDGEGFGPGRGPRGGFGPGGGFGPEGGPRSRGGRGGRGRRPRGDVRIAVLLLLDEEPMHGYQLMQTITDRTGGRWAPSPGAIYPTLSQLEDEGLVLTAKEGGRKLAELTEQGRTHVAEHREGWSDPFAAADGQDGAELPDLRAAMHDLGGSVREAGRGGDAAQMTAVAEVLAEARRSVYRILAGDAPVAAEQAPTTPETDEEEQTPEP